MTSIEFYAFQQLAKQFQHHQASLGQPCHVSITWLDTEGGIMDLDLVEDLTIAAMEQN